MRFRNTTLISLAAAIAIGVGMVATVSAQEASTDGIHADGCDEV